MISPHLWKLTLLSALQCGAAFQEDDIIVLNGTKEDVELLKKRMEERRLRAKLEKVTRGLHFCSRVHCKLFCCLSRCWGWGELYS